MMAEEDEEILKAQLLTYKDQVSILFWITRSSINLQITMSVFLVTDTIHFIDDLTIGIY